MAGDQLPSRRRRLGLRKELLLAIAPTVTVLLVLQRLTQYLVLRSLGGRGGKEG